MESYTELIRKYNIQSLDEYIVCEYYSYTNITTKDRFELGLKLSINNLNFLLGLGLINSKNECFFNINGIYDIIIIIVDKLQEKKNLYLNKIHYTNQPQFFFLN